MEADQVDNAIHALADIINRNVGVPQADSLTLSDILIKTADQPDEDEEID